MKDKINYILGGITVLIFSLVASTAFLQMGDELFHRSSGVMGELEGCVAAHLGQIHRWLALLFLLIGIFVIIRYWSWITSMTEIIKMERACNSEPTAEEPEVAEEINYGGEGADSHEGVVTPISEHEVEELEQELDEAEEGDDIDEIDELDDEGKEEDGKDHPTQK